MTQNVARMNTPLEPFHCHECGNVLGYTARGEAKRINSRAHVFCELCKDKPHGLTERMEDLIKALTEQRESGEVPTFTYAAEVLGVSRTRVQQIASSIRARGLGARLDEALGYEGVASNLAPLPEVSIDEPTSLAPPRRLGVVTSPPDYDPGASGENEFLPE